MRRLTSAAALLLAAMLAGCGESNPSSDAPRRLDLIIILDGLRPDYIGQAMPTLTALGRRGGVMRSHHAVYPTVTRVNAASLSTGAYPQRHGLLGNAVYFPAVDETAFLDTSDRDNLLRIEAAGEPLLTATTLGEALTGGGARLLVASAGSAGSSYLLNHTPEGGAIIHYDYARPASLHAQALEVVGPVPEADAPNWRRNRWVVDALLDVAMGEVDPDVVMLWLSDPDTTAHRYGMGHQLTSEALFYLDAELDRIQARLSAEGRLDTTNIWVTSDHGFSEHTGAVDLDALLAPFQGVLDDGTPRIVSGAGAVYVRDGDDATVREIVDVLQRTEGVGALFTAPVNSGDDAGAMPGTLSFDVARWGHARAAQVLYSADWTNQPGAYGFPGTSAQGGVAGHGTTSPFDIHTPLMAAGPDLKSGVIVDVPSSNVDLAPTLLHLRGIEAPASMDGRVMLEALDTGPDPGTVAVDVTQVRMSREDGAYAVTAATSSADDATYLDFTVVERP